MRGDFTSTSRPGRSYQPLERLTTPTTESMTGEQHVIDSIVHGLTINTADAGHNDVN